METVFRKEIKYLISRKEAIILQQKLDGIMERDIMEKMADILSDLSTMIP